jgi:diaminohydroxyphosphoribosylaminopyrimidine deaminase/5-amino-6-(5-phosphoribosylamino)uracil reductase
MTTAEDEGWMRQALALAERGRGFVEPNPLVGAVVVQEGRLVGSGWHERYGAAHAEINALAEAGPAARGATLYVTLEPCCHQGKTPPCTEAILQAGIARVVAAMTDPFPQVAGQGERRLRQAGVQYQAGACQIEARRLNAPYLTLLTQGRPYVHLKWAMTLDGKIATRTGQSRWISNAASRRLVHQLRGRMDAIIVGIGTAVADNPLLTARPPGPRTAARIVLDSHGRLPDTCQLVRTTSVAPTIVATTAAVPQERGARLQQLRCEVLPLPAREGRPDVCTLLKELGRRRLTNVLVEGGAAVLGAFLDADLLDEVHAFIAPRLVGGTEARTPMAGRGRDTIAEALTLDHWQVATLENDVYLHGWREAAK